MTLGTAATIVNELEGGAVTVPEEVTVEAENVKVPAFSTVRREKVATPDESVVAGEGTGVIAPGEEMPSVTLWPGTSLP